MIKGVRRVSVAVNKIDEALRFYRDALGLPVSAEMDLPDRGLRVVRLALGETDVELMEPTSPDGPVGTFLQRRGEGLHHIAIEVEDIELEMRTLLARGVELIDREARTGPEGRIAFIHPRSTAGVLVELYEAHPAPRVLPPEPEPAPFQP
jgi:methylmalonyl-CoA epimerase